MRKYPVLLLVFCLLLCTGCGGKAEGSRCEPILKEGERYEITLTQGKQSVTGCLFFSEGGVLHFLHTDQTSPRFGLEEVFEADRVSSYFHDMTWEGPLTPRGTSLLYPLVRALRTAEPGKEKGLWRYENEDVSVIRDGNEVSGTVCGRPIRIVFLSDA